MAKPTRSKDTAKPRKNGIESFWIEKNFNCADADADTRSSRLIASFRIEIEMNGLDIIIYWCIDKYKRIDGMTGMPYTRQFMKKSGSTVYGFEMRDIIFLDPHRINQRLHTIRKAEIKNIFRMGITNWKTERRFSYQSVEQDFLVIFPRRDVEKDVFSVNTRSDNW